MRIMFANQHKNGRWCTNLCKIILLVSTFISVESGHFKMVMPPIHEAAKSYDVPYLVSVQQMTKSNAYSHICAGTIIHKRLVLTLWQCFTNSLYDSTKFIVKAGRLSLLDKPETYEQTVVVKNIHPGPWHESREFSIAALLLENDLQLNDNGPVSAAHLPSSSIDFGSLFTAGWAGGSAPHVGATKVRMVDKDTCKTLCQIIDKSRNSPNYLCADQEFIERPLCFTDAGGPLMTNMTGQKNVLVGVAAVTGSPCDESDALTLFLPVSEEPFRFWLSNLMRVETDEEGR